MSAKRKKFKFNRLLSIFLIISAVYLLYHIWLLGPIEPLIRYIIMGVIIVINVLVLNKVFRKKGKKKYIGLLMLLFILINIGLGLSINKIYSTLSDISKNKTVYSTSLVVLTENEANKITKIKNYTIGMLDDEKSQEGYILAKKIIKDNNLEKTNKIQTYSSYPEILENLYNKKIDAALIPSNYESMFSEIDKYKNIEEDIKVIITTNEKASSQSKTYGTKKITEPFSILLIGIDSSKEGLSNSDSFNGDSLMLVTFNPKTLNATILSIPRDSYVPIACFENKYENKITHAAWKGTDCIINTIQDFTGIKIDYYAKINFKGLVGLVNALDGITVDVPKNLCTDSSNRKGKVCIKKGVHKLNGEEALVLARNRKQLAGGDLDRGINQQIVLQGIMDSAKNIDNVDKVTDILNVISDNLDMNMTQETILSFYDVGKTILSKSKGSDNLITLERLYLSGSGQTIYDEHTKLYLWNYILNEDSLNDVVTEMKINLGLEEYTMIKEFNFSINKLYEKKIIGKGPYNNSTTYTLVPDFTSYSKTKAESWGEKNNITIVFNEVEKTTATFKDGQIIDQSYPAKKRTDKITDKKITLTIVKKKTVAVEPIAPPDEANTDSTTP